MRCIAVDALRELFPHGRFNLPATEADIAAVEGALGIRIPDQLRRLYLICDGFREDRGNSQYLLSLRSLLSDTRFMWVEFAIPDLRPFLFFGLSSGDDRWWINWQRPGEIIAYHYNMEDQYEVVGSDIIEVYRADYARYEEFEREG